MKAEDAPAHYSALPAREQKALDAYVHPGVLRLLEQRGDDVDFVRMAKASGLCTRTLSERAAAFGLPRYQVGRTFALSRENWLRLFRCNVIYRQGVAERQREIAVTARNPRKVWARRRRQEQESRRSAA